MTHLISLVAFSAVALLGCSRLFVMKVDSTSDIDGLRYSLQVPKIRITYLEKAVYDGPKSEEPRIVRGAKVELVTIPDATRTYLINLKSGWFSADSFGITYADNGAISGYNATTVDQTAIVVEELGKIALAGAALAASPDSKGIQRRPPPEGTRTLDITDRMLLNAAIKRVEQLQKRLDQEGCNSQNSGKSPDELSKLCSPLTKDEREELTTLATSISALQKVLFTADEVVGKTYIDLQFVPDNETSVDEYVIKHAAALRGSERSAIVAVAKRVP